jgi:ketosteroid isomerase-like protein
MKALRLILTTGLMFIAHSLAISAEDSSAGKARTPNQRLDVDTIQRIEAAWLTAEYRGDVAFLDDLLAPGYSVTSVKTKVVRSKAELLAQVAKKAGNTSEIPPLETMVIINGEFATAYSSMKGHKKTGEPFEAAFVDSYVFRDGAWHALTGFDL